MNVINLEKNSKRGVTLIEMLIYTGILAAVSVLVVSSLLLLAKPFTVLKISRDVHSSASASLERMTREIRNAGSTGASSVFNSHPGTLELIDGSTTTVFSLDGGSILLNQNSSDIGALTRDGMTVTNLVFSSLSNIVSEGVRIEMTIEGTKGDITKSESFTTFVVLRGSY